MSRRDLTITLSLSELILVVEAVRCGGLEVRDHNGQLVAMFVGSSERPGERVTLISDRSPLKVLNTALAIL